MQSQILQLAMDQNKASFCFGLLGWRMLRGPGALDFLKSVEEHNGATSFIRK